MSSSVRDRLEAPVKSADDAVAAIERLAVVVALVIMLATMAGVIASRYIGGLSWGRYSDLGVGLIPWAGLLGASLAIRSQRHVGIMMLRERLGARGRRILELISQIIVILFFLILFRSGLDLTFHQIQSGMTTPAMEMPRWIISLSVPVASALAIFHQTVKIVYGAQYPADEDADHTPTVDAHR